MAAGEFAEPIFKLLGELEGHTRQDLVLLELIRFLPGETISEFVEEFRRNHDMTFGLEDDDTETLDEEDNNNKFFSSLIPEC